ncbi:MAG: exodeoxyribonuclease VII small subunit [Anaerolineae bacterium]|nr:exodeoxyribonuclease VII small subunit [Anaerolineae bacterium]
MTQQPLPDSLTFEEALTRLEQIITRLEEGSLTLEESVALFEQGQRLAQFCQDALDSAELRVRELTDLD